MSRRPRPGDRVRAPFGLETREGRVVYVAPTPRKPRVTVAFETDDPDDPMLNIYKTDEIELIIPAA